MNQSDMALIRVVNLQGVKRKLPLEALSRDGWSFLRQWEPGQIPPRAALCTHRCCKPGIMKPRKAFLTAIESPLLLRDRELACHSNVLVMPKCAPFEYARAQKCHRVLKK